jgi:hypothetical protein
MTRSQAEQIEALIRLAEDYPYHRPSVGYLFDDGAIRPLEPRWHEQRIAVIACGSNGAPARLARKFAGTGAQIPVTPAWLADWAVVYSAHFTSYGALPATLHPCPGARTRLCVTWLTTAQLEVMHRSEGAGLRYDYVELDRLELEIEGHGTIACAGSYRRRRGPLAQAGRPVRLAETLTHDCDLEAWTQPAMLRRMHRLLAPDGSYTAFMSQILGSHDFRGRATAALEALVDGAAQAVGAVKR